MPINNGEIIDNKVMRDEKGHLLPGSKLAPAKRKRTQTDKLLAALKREGKKQGVEFWDVVAEAAFGNKDIMKAVVGKLVPNVSEITGLGGEPININLIKTIYSESINESNER
ncbi:MAG: hypothetical protein MUP69_10460 [Candidatus Atribacteria bacterium]|nr:hypothetical protein [Candidatus Atribacteria bacterium]